MCLLPSPVRSAKTSGRVAVSFKFLLTKSSLPAFSMRKWKSALFLIVPLLLFCGCKTLLKRSSMDIKMGPKLPVGLYEMGYATDGKIIFSLGGSTFLGTVKQAVGEIYLFSPYTDEWQKGRFVAKPLVKGAVSSAYIPESKLILSTGFSERLRGNNYTFPIELLDLDNYRIEYIRSNPHYAVESCIVGYRGKAYTFGGIAYAGDGSSEFSNRMLEYDISLDEWKDLAPMPKPRVTTGVVVGNSLYTFGGYDSEHTYADIWRYDFESDFWETITNLPYPARNFGIAFKFPFVFLVTVGQDKNMIGRFDIRDGSYKDFKTWLSVSSPGVAIVGNELFLFGGSFDNNNTASNRTFRIDLAELVSTDEQLLPDTTLK